MTDKHYNEHRKSKKPIQAMLTKDEFELVDEVRKQRGFTSIREMIVTFCNEYKKIKKGSKKG